MASVIRPSNPLKKLKSLLIDNDEGIRKSLSLFFRVQGYNLHTYETAESVLKSSELDCYDIFLCDYRLGGMNGIQFLKIIKKAYPKAITILISGHADKEVTAEARQAGINAIIKKPFTGDSIEKSLIRLFENSHNKTAYA